MNAFRYILLIIALLLLPSGSDWSDVYAQQRNTNTKSTATNKPAPKKPAAKKVDKKTQLRNEKEATIRARKAEQQRAAQLAKNIKTNLDSVLILDHRIGNQRASIDSLAREIEVLRVNINRLQKELDSLQANLEMRKQHYAKGLVHMRRNRSLQNRMMFVFSAKNFSQLTRRFRYLKEYSSFQKAQAEIIREQQIVIKKKQDELIESKARIEANRAAMQKKQKEMEQMKSSVQIKVNFLNKNLATVKQHIKVFQQKEASLDAAIERLIQEEIASSRRAREEQARRQNEAAAKRKADAEERARKLANAKSAQDRARQKLVEAEAKRKQAEADLRAAKTEEERAAAKAAEERARAEEERARAEMKNAESDTKAAAKAEKAGSKEDRRAEKDVDWKSSDSDMKLSNSFANNKGRLPMPVTGSYSVVGHYGRYTPSGLSSVVLENKGMDVRAQAGGMARSIFDGVVSKVFQYQGRYIVMVRHGLYISVYSNLSSVHVSAGQRVSTKDTLGAIGTNSEGNYVLHFQLRKESSCLNPELWVRR